MKKIVHIFTITWVSIFFLSSCESFLEETPYNKIVAGNYYTTASGIEKGVNGVYAGLRDLYGSGVLGSNNVSVSIPHFILYMCEAPTDIWRTGNSMELEFRNWTIDASSANVNQFWTVCYRGINQANEVIDALTNLSIEALGEGQRKIYLAEARFIRAHYYYHLVQQFGEVELTTSPTKSAVTAAYKTPTDQIWQFIIDELKFCMEDGSLPEAPSQYGRLSKYAAMHHLARVYLTLNRSNQDWQDAKNLTEAIIKSNQYTLVNSHKDLWDLDKKRNSEIIFPVLYSKDRELNSPTGNVLHVAFVTSYSDFYATALIRSLEYGRPYNRIRPTYYLQNLYNEDLDQRWEDCFRTAWCSNVVDKNGNPTSAEDKAFSPHTKKIETIVWNIGDTVYYIPKKKWTPEQVAAAWPQWIWMPDSMTTTINKGGIQSDTNPDGIWPSNTKIQSPQSYPNLMKYMDPQRPTIDELNGSRDIFVFRLADTYLLAAEACHLLGDNNTAAGYINVVRQRAAIPGKEEAMKIDASQVDMNFILDERARELAGELHRWYDLIRTGQLYDRMNNPDMNPVTAGIFKDYHVLRPIPRTQLERISNPDEFKQNDGYAN